MSKLIQHPDMIPAPGITKYGLRRVGHIILASGCWEWTGARIPKGYGRIMEPDTGRGVYAHRYYYEAFVGPIPAGLEIDHLCDHPWCVNPEHLRAVTGWANNARSQSTSALNALKTHCKRGHEFTAKNTYITKHWWRYCRRCGADSQQRTKRRQMRLAPNG